jgi:predicted choloylglycine hydrolase
MLFLCFLLYFFVQIRIEYPDVPKVNLSDYQVEKISETEWILDDSWLKKNQFGVWEVFVVGDDYERGIKYGVLTKKLMELQEDYFVAQINEIIPNSFYLNFLKVFVAWFNKDMPEYIPEEYQKEIYGVSLSFSDKYDYIAPKYYRILNYHAAHDIGHALKDLSLVGCTSFGASGLYTTDSSLIIGRNFDFYMGDDFAKDKLVTFMKPTKGFNYVSYSWAGLMGVVSGMNEKGLTVTINASKSDLPFGAKMPISLLAREILQYASNHEEAIAIAKKRDVFVSETLMIGSKEDNGVILLEKSPEKFGYFISKSDYTVCSNHYQSDAYLNEPSNVDNIKNSDSQYRYRKMDSLITNSKGIDPTEVARILRFKEDDKGMGNPKLINQMIAHHACIFKPQDGLAWFSSGPYQMGEIFCYDLQKIFDDQKNYIVDSLTIAADPFINTPQFVDYEYYKKIKLLLHKDVNLGIAYHLDAKTEKQFIASNPKLYTTYMILGEYYKNKENCTQAKLYFSKALECSVASLEEEVKIETLIKECQ